MDPRMDSGVGRSTQPDPQFDPLQPLTASEVATIIDLSLACEVTWYTGRLLSQTVLTSSYLRHLDSLKSHPDQVVKHVLRASLLGLVKSCAIVSDEISKDNLRENEDVNSEQQTIDIYEDIDVTQTLEALDEAYSILKSWPNELDGYRIPLMERVRFRIEFLYSLALPSSSPTVETVSQVEAHLDSALEALGCTQRDPTYPAHSTLSFSAQNDPVRAAFNLNFYQTVSSNSPPRPVYFPHSFAFLVDMTRRILEELSLVSQVALANSFSDWMSFFHAFSRREPMAFPFVRSYLMSLFQSGNVIGLDPDRSLNWLAKDCMTNLSAGRLCFPSNGSDTNTYMLNRLAGFLVNYLSAFAANRARGRRILSNSLSEWKSLYNTTWVNQLDLAPSTLQRLQALIYYFSIESGLQMTLMGFDLELYELDDDRRAMWWVVERLSERAWLLLKILSDGAESLDAKLIRILGKLAGVAGQLTRRKNKHAGTPPSEFRLREAVFERRIKLLKARQASFDDSTLVSELDLPAPLLDYQAFVSSELVVLTPTDLDATLQDIKDQLLEILFLNRRHNTISILQLQCYLNCLIKSTKNMIQINQTYSSSRPAEMDPGNDEPLSLKTLKISSSSSNSNDNDNGHQRGRIQLDEHPKNQMDCQLIGLGYSDLASKWFII
ncbi:uncharacterized protein PGTG_10100 [Puccinia graminis f. sp. tritici CRL 75-36-700-3]|uniref:Uncharacterized protein n=1 Tax=Puccinia graminis f. sp. tritici (strain CRL 75-36-700-3 / race SCCL) TaxID=418459 RepID=E3KJA5_PUCGT|nr:uncharacterized protein PGTG_10100 [Puccinia graminis f. sp. tritici CRL 75-36-700-3]EFP84380.2 hypothetical protein PGTG_10100 [Puccinia graminis f. sp. tritici CRL 75-36-700-3]